MSTPVFDSTSGYGPFRVAATVYTQGVRGSLAEAAWVRDFDTVNQSDLAVLYKPLGGADPGLYMRDQAGRWRFYLPYQELVSYFSASTASMDVLVGGGSGYTPPDGAKVYQHGVIKPDGTVPDGSPGWAVVTVDALLENTVTKPSVGTQPSRPGALQIAGTGTTIKDFVPVREGIVSVDAQGVPTVLPTVNLTSGAGLPLGTLIIR